MKIMTEGCCNPRFESGCIHLDEVTGNYK